jgi:hypothetical protein
MDAVCAGCAFHSSNDCTRAEGPGECGTACSGETLSHVRQQVRECIAQNPDGFDESTIRTISENSRTLKFEHFGFEEG